MRLEILVLVSCVCVIKGKKNISWNSEENEVLGKGVMARFPSYLYQVPKETLNRNYGVQRRFRERTVPANVEPMEGTNKFLFCSWNFGKYLLNEDSSTVDQNY